MIMDKGALRPDGFRIPDFIKKDTGEDIDSAEEKILAGGAEQIFWKTLKKYFDSSIEQLEQINESAISSGMPLEEIGRNALVISQVKGVLRKIENVVGDAKEALDERTQR